MGHRIKLHLSNDYDETLAPIPASKLKDWWEDNQKTLNHAKHCLPLNMANSLGYYILSPGTFIVKWNGDTQGDCSIEHIDRSSHYEVDAHAAYGSFTVQAKFIPVTDDPGDFIFIKGVPNERGTPFSCMEAIIEAWWNVGFFGLVFILNQPGEFIIRKGQPIAQMFLYHGAAGYPDIETIRGYPQAHAHWLARRSRPDYRKDLDYMKGYDSHGSKINTHITTWRSSISFRN
jgi:hypothetical protein